MNLDLTDEETAVLLKELNGLIDGDRYVLSPRIKTLKAIRAKIRREPVRPPLPPPPKRYRAATSDRAAETTEGGALRTLVRPVIRVRLSWHHATGAPFLSLRNRPRGHRTRNRRAAHANRARTFRRRIPGPSGRSRA